MVSSVCILFLDFHNTAINVFVIACSGIAVGVLMMTTEMFIIFACVCFQVEFEDASQLVLKRGELWTEDEDLPKYVKSRLVSQTVLCEDTLGCTITLPVSEFFTWLASKISLYSVPSVYMFCTL